MTDKTVFKKNHERNHVSYLKEKKLGISKKTETKKPNNNLTNLMINRHFMQTSVKLQS